MTSSESGRQIDMQKHSAGEAKSALGGIFTGKAKKPINSLGRDLTRFYITVGLQTGIQQVTMDRSKLIR